MLVPASPRNGRDTYQKENCFLSKINLFPIKKTIVSYQKENCFLSKKLIRITNKIPPAPLVLVCWFPGRLVLWSLCLVPLSGPLIPCSLGPLVPLDPWSSGPLVLCSLGPLVLWSSGPLVLRPGLQVLGSVLSRQDAFKAIWKCGHTYCDAP